MHEHLSVYLWHPPDAAMLAHLRELLDPHIDLTTGPALPEHPAYHVLVTGHPTHDLMSASPALHTLVIPFAGLPEEARALLHDFPHVAVHNLHHNASATAELAVALLLAAAKAIVPMDRALRANDWTPRYQPNASVLLAGKTALILGYGAIGQLVARACRGLDIRVLATRRAVTKTPPGYPDEIYPSQALHDLLPRANALVICLPLTAETRGLIGERELALLPSDAILVNVSRGPIVDEAALYQALRDGTLRAAGLDVWYNYPADKAARTATPPAHYPFHQLDNVVLSPHRGGALNTEGVETLYIDALARLLNAIARGGEPVPGQVDVERGY